MYVIVILYVRVYCIIVYIAVKKGQYLVYLKILNEFLLHTKDMKSFPCRVVQWSVDVRITGSYTIT